MPTYAYEGPKWVTPVVTWSFAPTSGVFTDPISAAYQALVQQAVARWDGVIGITLQQVPDSAAADIRIGFSSFGAAVNQIGNTSYSYMPGTITSFVAGVTVAAEDPAQRPVGTSGLYAGTNTSLYQVLLHEIGHALGLAHSTDPNSVMYPVATASNQDLNAGDIAGIQGLYGAQGFSQTDTTNGVSTVQTGEAYPASGPVPYLQAQDIYSGTDSLAIAAVTPNVFIHTGSGNDAITVTSGQNVLDAGQGSNFLTGGTGNDTFFVDGRGGGVTWDTLVNFHAGDTMTLWGFTDGTSGYIWADNDGTAGYTGRTIHADLAGTGGVTASVTFAGASAADTARYSITTGVVGNSSYLAVTNLG